MKSMEEVEVSKFRRGLQEKELDSVVREHSLTIFLNGEEVVNLLCSPSDLECLGVGYLLSEGFLMDGKDIKSVLLKEEDRIEIEIENGQPFLRKGPLTITSGCGRGATFRWFLDRARAWKINSSLKVSREAVLRLMSQLQNKSKLFQSTGGVHSASLADEKDVLIFKEDIGRHNAMDKVLGEAFLRNIKTDDKIALTSGRLSSEIVLKIVKRKIPVLVSRAAPTSLGIELAERVGVTLIGFARGERMNIYTHPQRLQ